VIIHLVATFRYRTLLDLHHRRCKQVEGAYQLSA
jgi:hypothetical protein